MGRGKRNYTATEVRAINKVKEENDTCYYCGCSVNRSQRSADHKVPYSRGGATVPENLVMACERCNNEKGMLTDIEYQEILEEIDAIVSNNTTLQYLNTLNNIHKNVVESYNSITSKISKKTKEKNEIEKIIMDCSMSASDGYLLARDLKVVLLEISELNKQHAEITPVRNLALIEIKNTENKIKTIKGNIFSKCKTKYINNLDIVV